MNFEELVEINHKEIEEDTIIWYSEIEDLCYRSYPRHPKGCPNIDKCEWLNIPTFGTILEYGRYTHFYLIYAKFDFKQYKKLREKEHPNWTENQIKCVLYWQKSVIRLLKNYLNNLNLKDSYVLGCGSGFDVLHQKRVGSMENSCINVFSTMKLNGIKMEVKPENVIYLVCLICSQKEIKFKNYNEDLDKWI